MKLFITIILSIFVSISCIAQEWQNLKTYQKATGENQLQAGHWLKKDRRKKTANWSKANLYNLLQEKGSLKYRSIAQQRDFYKWSNQLSKEKGHEIKWLETAINVTKRYALIETKFVKTFVINDIELNNFFSKYTKALFTDVVPFLKILLTQKEALIGKEAKDWDMQFLRREQCTIAPPHYDAQPDRIIRKFTRMAKGQGIYKLGVPRNQKFEGDLLNCEDRVNHAWTKIMKYKTPID